MSLPIISVDSDCFECRFCDWKEKCWKNESLLEPFKGGVDV